MFPVDLHDDLGELLLRYKDLISEELLKTATWKERDDLLDREFALILVDDNGREHRKFACHDAGTTAASILYMMKNAENMPPLAGKVAAENLVTFADHYGISTPESLIELITCLSEEKVAALEVQLDSRRVFVPRFAEKLAVIVEAAKAGKKLVEGGVKMLRGAGVKSQAALAREFEESAKVAPIQLRGNAPARKLSPSTGDMLSSSGAQKYTPPKAAPVPTPAPNVPATPAPVRTSTALVPTQRPPAFPGYQVAQPAASQGSTALARTRPTQAARPVPTTPVENTSMVRVQQTSPAVQSSGGLTPAAREAVLGGAQTPKVVVPTDRIRPPVKRDPTPRARRRQNEVIDAVDTPSAAPAAAPAAAPEVAPAAAPVPPDAPTGAAGSADAATTGATKQVKPARWWHGPAAVGGLAAGTGAIGFTSGQVFGGAMQDAREGKVASFDLVQEAAERWEDMSFEEKRRTAVELVKLADAEGASVPKKIWQYAGSTLNPKFASVVISQRKNYTADAELSDLYDRLGAMADYLGPEKTAELLFTLDQRASLTPRYGRNLPDPMLAVWGQEKTAAASWVYGGDYVNEDQLRRYAASMTSYHALEQVFSEDFRDKFRANPVAMFNAAPLEQKILLSRMASQSRESNDGGT
jgi:hypothetical protein